MTPRGARRGPTLLPVKSPDAGPQLIETEASHRPRLISSGVVEGLNNKANEKNRTAFAPTELELALYHSLGKLPEPESTHDFF